MNSRENEYKETLQDLKLEFPTSLSSQTRMLMPKYSIIFLVSPLERLPQMLAFNEACPSLTPCSVLLGPVELSLFSP